jgi:hypothetical protein
MVRLNKIYTRTGDNGTTGLVTGPRRSKSDLRVDTYGSIDEANAFVGLARQHGVPVTAYFFETAAADALRRKLDGYALLTLDFPLFSNIWNANCSAVSIQAVRGRFPGSSVNPPTSSQVGRFAHAATKRITTACCTSFVTAVKWVLCVEFVLRRESEASPEYNDYRSISDIKPSIRPDR